MIRQTSLSAHEIIQIDGTAKTQRQVILDFLKRGNRGFSRNELSRLLGIRINAVCGRIRKLIQDGLVYESGEDIDRFSGKKNYVLKAVEEKFIYGNTKK